MVTRVVILTPAPDPGDTLMVVRPAVVLHRLPRMPGRRPAVRVTADLLYDREALADLAGEQLADGARAGKARRERGRRSRQVARSVSGASAVLLRVAAGGGAPSRAYLLDSVTGPERRALAWVLRDAGDRPLSAERCRDLAAELRKWEE